MFHDILALFHELDDISRLGQSLRIFFRDHGQLQSISVKWHGGSGEREVEFGRNSQPSDIKISNPDEWKEFALDPAPAGY